MALFEQRISDDEVTAARTKMLAGASLRSAAAEIPCAPSTLSTRIKKAERAEADARERPESGDQARRADAVGGDVGPVEILRHALLATRPSGQPDWPTRVSAARTLAALRPQEVELKTEPEQTAEPSIVVYDLPPGADPVLHRAADAGATAAASDAEPQSEPQPASDVYLFDYQPPDGEIVPIGTWSPAGRERSQHDAAIKVTACKTDDHETAEFWRAELSAGRRPPPTSENVP